MVARILILGLSLASLVAAQPALAATASGGAYTPVSPVRLLDTRSTQALGAGATIDLGVAGSAGVPSGATAAILNITATAPTAGGFLTLWPAGQARPASSNLNFSPGETVANLVQVGLGSGGAVSIYNSFGSTQVVADLAGFVVPGSGAAGRYTALEPARVLDTRGGSAIGPGALLRLPLLGQGGIPSGGVSAVALNFTSAGSSAGGYLTAFPAGAPVPAASTLNFSAGQLVANRSIVKLGEGGAIEIFNAFGSTDVVADVSGWFSDGSASASGALFTPVTPSRILDSRGAGPLGPGGSLTVKAAGAGGVPSSGATAGVANVTVTDTTGAGYLTAWPGLSARPLASDLNWNPGQTVPNLVLVRLGADGTLNLFNFAACANVIVDVVGYYSGGVPASPTATPPPPVACPPPPPPPAPARSALASLINQDRAAAGLPPLAWNACLAAVALANAERMAAAGAISHADGVTRDLACGLGSAQTGENVAYWSGGVDDGQANTMYMNSPGHRANILGPYRFVGTAWTVAPDGTGYNAEEFG